ncbi:MAG: hypothetical protein CFE32_05220 [Alphaproteobacteria bacterium PA3]|nr:MAG: hypothetical protein CFE32_05220 [Alphaproteobacteria bacterium PA3]
MLGMTENVADSGTQDLVACDAHGLSLEPNAKSCVLIYASMDEASQILSFSKALKGQELNWAGIITPDSVARSETLNSIPVQTGLDTLRPLIALQHQKGFGFVTLVVGETVQPLGPDELAAIGRGDAGQGYQVITLTPFRLANKNAPPSDRRTTTSYYAAKRWFEVCLVVLIGLLLIPAFGLIALGNFLSAPKEPIFFRQWRPGLMGKPFLLCKFRSFKCSNNSRGGPEFNSPNHVTHWGNFLRRWRLDELPQLWNVIIGDMALIGPRPLLMRDQPQTHDRLRVRPGLTGWAQINGGQLLSISEKNALDLFYVRRVNLLFDLKVLALTAWRLFKGDRVHEKSLQQALHEQASG